MNIENPIFLFLCFFALIPWVLFFLQYFIGAKIVLPSLIFYFESYNIQKKHYHEWINYLLQSLSLLCLAFIISGIHFSFSKKQEISYFCLVDDLVHTQWEVDKYNNMKKQLGSICKNKFYSLVDLSYNQLKSVNESQLHRNENIILQKIFLQWSDYFKNTTVLFIASKNNYIKNMENFSDINLKIYPIELQDKNNVFFKTFSFKKHLTDYRKRELHIQLNQKSNFYIHRKDETISYTTNTKSSYSGLMNVNFKYEQEIIKIDHANDSFKKDNSIYMVLHAHKPLGVSIKNTIPKPVQSILNISSKDFPYFWFKKGQDLTIRSEKNITNKKFKPYTIYFFKDVSLENNAGLKLIDQKDTIFKKYYFGTTYYLKSLNSQLFEIYNRFTDGNIAIYKSKPYGGIFLFDMETASTKLLEEPKFSIYLLKSLIDLSYKNRVQYINTEKERNELLPHLKNKNWKSGIIKYQNKTFILNYHSNAVLLSNQAYPSQLIFNVNSTFLSEHYKFFILTFFVLLIIILYRLGFQIKWLDNKVNKFIGYINRLFNRLVA